MCAHMVTVAMELYVGDDRTEMLFAAYSDEEYNKWIVALEQVIKHLLLEGSAHSRESIFSGDRLVEVGTHLSPSCVSSLSGGGGPLQRQHHLRRHR